MLLKSLRRKTIKDLRQNWKQFLSVWIVVVLGAAFYGAMYPSGKNLEASILNTYKQLDYMDYQVKLEPVSKHRMRYVLAIPQVAAAEGRLVIESGLQIDPQHDHLTNLRLISLPDQGEAAVNRCDIPLGRPPENTWEILLLKRFADHFHIQVGDTLFVWLSGEKYRLRVAGLAFNPEYLVAGRSREAPFPSISSFGVAWIRYADLVKMTGLDGMINDVAVLLKEDVEFEAAGAAIQRSLERALGDEREMTILERTQTASGGVVEANINGNFPVIISFSALFLSGAVLITAVLLGRLVESERQRIGTLRALGVTRLELVAHYLAFGLLVGVTGGLAGSMLGYFASFLTMYPFIATIAGGYLPGFVNKPQIPFISLGFAIVAAGSTLAGAYPAWRESGTPPGIALRPPAPRSPSAISRLRLRLLPLALRQVLRNLLRVPGRSLGTALGVMAGSMMIFSSLAIIDSVKISFEDYYLSGSYDLRLTLDAARPVRDVESDVRSITGVQSVQGALMGLVTVKYQGQDDFDTLAIVVDEKQPYFNFKTLAGAPAFSRSDGVWVGHNLRRVLDLHVGDKITLKAGDEEKETEVLGVVSQVMGSPLVVPRSLMVKWLPGKIFVANTALVRVQPDRLTAVQDELADVPGVVAVQDYAQFVTDMRNYVAYWQQTASLFGLFGCLLTLAVIANTVNASLHEQQNELAILRSLGIRQGEIVLMVMLELLIMVALGASAGVPAGREIGFWMIRAYDTDFYGLLGSLQPVSYWVGVTGMLLTALLAEIPGLRAVGKIDLGQVSKSQSI
ncbi:MAG: FtsX-like permease family protein [Chloroflexota bacterium]